MSEEEELFEEHHTPGILGVKLGLLHEDVNGIKTVLKELTVAVNRLAVVEERQSQASAALERAFVALEKVELRISIVERRVSDLEKQGVTTKQTNIWVERAVWSCVVVLAMLIGKKLGVL